MKLKTKLVFGIILIAAVVRLFVMQIPNFAPITAMALFGAAYFDNKKLALIIPIAALWVGNLIINNTIYAQYYEGFTLFSANEIFVYLAFILIALAAMPLLKKVTISKVIVGSISATLLFFLLTNFGAWALDPFHMYADDIAGLTTAFVAGLPFLKFNILGDLVFSGILFGAYELAKAKTVALA